MKGSSYGQNARLAQLEAVSENSNKFLGESISTTITNFRFEDPGTGPVICLGGAMKDGPSITRNVKPGDVQRVHVDVVSVVLQLLQRITGRETGQGDRVAGHHPHLAPVGEAEVLLEVLLMVEDGPDHNFALQLQRHNLEGRQPVLVRDRGHLQVGVTGREELYCRDLGAVDLTVSKGWTPAVTCEDCVGGVASPG